MNNHESLLRDLAKDDSVISSSSRDAIRWALERIKNPEEPKKLAMDTFYDSPRPWVPFGSYSINDANGRSVCENRASNGPCQTDRNCIIHCVNVLPELVEAAEEVVEHYPKLKAAIYKAKYGVDLVQDDEPF